MFDKKFELNDVHIGSDFNDKMLLMPSDQKNATVFIKIDQEQYIPMPHSYQSVFTSPTGANYNTTDKNMQTIDSGHRQ